MKGLIKFNIPTPLALREFLQTHSAWEVKDEKLCKEFRFKNFAHAMVFMNKAVNPIEEYQNYPKIELSYDRIYMTLFTNTVGAITEVDLEMAKEFDNLAGANFDPEKDYA